MTDQLPEQPTKHFCIAPFQSIRQNALGKNSPCAFGAGEWDHGHLTPIERWHSAELNQLRQEFIDGKQPAACHRCWAEEEAGKISLRQRQYEYFPNDYNDLVRSGKWRNGPKTAVFKTSNICNLACRSCAGWDSNTFAKEGQHYIDRYQTKGFNGQLHNRFLPRFPATHMNFMNYTGIADNLEKIDFFGGEPLLNITQLDLLEYLIDRGLNKKIRLFYSTNCTNHPTDRLKRAWNNFKRVEISMSIDGIGDQFEYLRSPGKWDTALEVIADIKSLSNQLDCEIYTMSGHTISIMNAYYADDTTKWLKENIGNIYVNMVESPTYLSLHSAPDRVKLAIREHVTHPEVLGYLGIQEHNPLLWKQFIIWMKRQDLYRNQNFSQTFPEFFNIIKEDWDSIIDLSETNFYKEKHD
jgi:MoaA/NifB/PqqE/SkfB family radical SAM enzyme